MGWLPSPADGLLLLSLLGTVVFAVNGALTALEAARLDIVGVITLGTITALGGGIARDVLLGRLPPEGLRDWRFLSTAILASALVFLTHRRLGRYTRLVTVLDAAGLGLFSVIGTVTALEHGAGGLLAVVLGTITGVGGGTVRDLAVQRIPVILTSGVYALPAAAGSVIVAVPWLMGYGGAIPSLAGATVCIAIRLAGVRYNLNPPQTGGDHAAA